jgi:hypothetical protein
MNQASNHANNFLEDAHKHSSLNGPEVGRSDICGCFYCLRTFKSELVLNFTDEGIAGGPTALCPFCDIDSVIGSDSGLPVSDVQFLKAMKNRFFG